MNTELTINLETIDEVEKFINVTNKFSSDIDIQRDSYIIDGKSMVGIFTIDFTKPVIVRINSCDSTEIARFNEQMKEFM